MHILTIANKKQTQKLKQDKQKELEKESGREVLNRQNGVFWDCFSPIFFRDQLIFNILSIVLFIYF